MSFDEEHVEESWEKTLKKETFSFLGMNLSIELTGGSKVFGHNVWSFSVGLKVSLGNEKR